MKAKKALYEEVEGSRLLQIYVAAAKVINGVLRPEARSARNGRRK